MEKKKIHKESTKGFSKKKSSMNQRCILIILAVIMIVTTGGISSLANEIDKAKEEKDRLAEKKAETELRLEELEKEKDDILKYIEKLDAEMSKIAGQVDDLNGKILKSEEDLKATQNDLDLAKETEEKQYDIMKKRIQYMYENGNSSVFDILAKSDDISDMLNQIEYMSKITEYDNGLLEEYTNIKKDISEKESSIKEQIAQLNDLREELTFEQETVEKLMTSKNKEAAKYNESIEETQAVSAEYTVQLDEQEALIEDLIEAEIKRLEEERKRKEEEERKRREEEERKKQEEEAANAGGGNESGDNSSGGSTTDHDSSDGVSGEFIWPLPASSRITSAFGYRGQPTQGASTYHKGIDIGAGTGTKIIAAASGTVVTSTYSVSAGNYIMISHGNGLYTVYMHCSKLFVSVGQSVSQGENIALVGSTGFSTGPHLHFGVNVGGEYVDPLKYVSY
ncbi:MAG: murein hydrolase activator EnvC family protein [Anaerocolumna sp.]